MDSLRLVSIVLALSSYVSGAPLNTICQVPHNLNIHYKKLAQEMKGYSFLTLSMHPQQPLNLTEMGGYKSCPSKLLTEGMTKDRSTCPWYNDIVYNSELFPSNWTEAVCLCEKCIGFDGTFGCEPVYSPALFLKRSKCVDGLYVYETYQAQIKTGCVCTLNTDKTKHEKE